MFLRRAASNRDLPINGACATQSCVMLYRLGDADLVHPVSFLHWSLNGGWRCDGRRCAAAAAPLLSGCDADATYVWLLAGTMQVVVGVAVAAAVSRRARGGVGYVAASGADLRRECSIWLGSDASVCGDPAPLSSVMAPGANLHLRGQILCVWYNHIYRCLFVFRMYIWLFVM